MNLSIIAAAIAGAVFGSTLTTLFLLHIIVTRDAEIQKKDRRIDELMDTAPDWDAPPCKLPVRGRR